MKKCVFPLVAAGPMKKIARSQGYDLSELYTVPQKPRQQ